MALWIKFVTFIVPQCLEHYTLCFEGLTLGKKKNAMTSGTGS